MSTCTMSTSTLSLRYWSMTVALQGPNSMTQNCLNHCELVKVFGLASNTSCHYYKFWQASTRPHGTINILFPNAFSTVTVIISALVGDEERPWVPGRTLSCTRKWVDHVSSRSSCSVFSFQFQCWMSFLTGELPSSLARFLTAPAAVVCC